MAGRLLLLRRIDGDGDPVELALSLTRSFGRLTGQRRVGASSVAVQFARPEDARMARDVLAAYPDLVRARAGPRCDARLF